MQRILVENARRKISLKAGGDHQQVDLSLEAAQTPAATFDLLEVDEALQKLEALDPRKASWSCSAFSLV